MKIVENTLSEDAQNQLVSLVGQKLEYVTGLGIKRFLASAMLLIVTADLVVDISATIVNEDFPGFREDFGRIRVGDSLESDISAAQRESTRFFKFSGEEIERVLIRRSTMTKTENGTGVWQYVSDIAIHFQVSSGWFALSLLNHHDQVLTVTYAANDEQLEIPETDSLFESDLFEKYEVSLDDFEIS